MSEKLTQEYVKKLFDYDSNTGELIWKVNKNNQIKIGNIAGCNTNKSGYWQTKINGVLYGNHRLIFLWCYGYASENLIDHIDKNKLNNKIENLREVSSRCNVRNTGNRKDNKSGVKGVFWDKNCNKWHSQITIMQNTKYLGCHDDFNEAVLHRLAAEQCLNWSNCDSSSPAYQYSKENGLIK